MRARMAGQSGQTFVEWLTACAAIVALGAAVTGAAPKIAGAVGAGARSAICAVGGSCASSGGHRSAGGPRRAMFASTMQPAQPTPTAGPTSSPTPTPGPTPTSAPTPAPTSLPGSPNVAADMPGPVPSPAPGPAPQPPGWRGPASAGNHADQLPTSGERPYSPGKEGRGKPVRVRGGDFKDEDGNIWEWAKDQHGGPHWDVQHPKSKKHTNVAPDGTVIGEDNFPNKRREPARPPDAEPDDGSGVDTGDAAKAVAVTGGGLLALWLAGKALSPLCGPLAPVCFIAG